MAKRGRPTIFDRDEAVERALELFWERGYEGVTLEDLQQAMGGITPPSFYHAFGSKEALFKEVVDLYLMTVGAKQMRALQQGTTARQSFEAFLREVVAAVSRPGKAHGCLLVQGALNCAASGKGAEDYVTSVRQCAPKVLKQRLDVAVSSGELSSKLDTAAIANFYATVVHGLGVRARDGATRKALMASVDGAMAAWDPLTATRSRRA
ncbi:MAG TPA: TetR/AcrR family transcriptional regulator [Vitreimonas sp.]|uniref:TetR/AcrR family transcriptional regulator n=1 Tax=Vitreimonas sp. TaxID=3069702 RepID=UPI002D529C70|nr:TetR/AcrR family transcriptional regulator [Vitreimonas sp.]HYD86930.1 TetR/AcrR family transcriptional regulator [Vitreimonas sp.]